MGNTAQQCRLGLFQDSDFAGDFEDSKSTSGRLLCIFGSHTFVHIYSNEFISHSPTEAEIISLDAGLRMDGIPALDLWDLVIELFHSSPDQLKKYKERVQGNLLRHTPSNKHTQNQTKTPIQHDILELSNVEYDSSNAKSSLFGAMLYIFEDNEAVIKMIIKGRSPTMRHVSRTHRVALDWLFDRINLIQSFKSYMSTPNTNSQTYWQREISHVMSGTIFSICLTSAISAQFAALRISATPASQKRWQKGCKKSKEQRGLWQIPNRR